MRGRRARSIALALVLVLVATPVFAAGMGMGMGGMNGMGHQKMFTFGIGGGVAVPVSDAKDALKNGFNGLAYARVQLPVVPVSFGVNVAFQRFDLKDATVSTGTGGGGGGGSTTPVTGNTTMLGGLGDVKLDLMHGAPIAPYIIAGIGAYNLKVDNTTAGASSSDSKTHFGINGGAGVAMHFGAISGYVQGRIDNVYTDTGGVINTKSVQVIPVTLGIEF